jgi:hypothetical protein
MILGSIYADYTTQPRLDPPQFLTFALFVCYQQPRTVDTLNPASICYILIVCRTAASKRYPVAYLDTLTADAFPA